MNPITAAYRYWRMRASWLGDGGQPVSQETAHARAATCLVCARNKHLPIWELLSAPQANTLRQQIALKAQMQLVVPGEDGLHSCEVCLCYLPLLVWAPASKILETLREADRADYPAHCWKLALLPPPP